MCGVQANVSLWLFGFVVLQPNFFFRWQEGFIMMADICHQFQRNSGGSFFGTMRDCLNYRVTWFVCYYTETRQNNLIFLLLLLNLPPRDRIFSILNFAFGLNVFCLSGTFLLEWKREREREKQKQLTKVMLHAIKSQNNWMPQLLFFLCWGGGLYTESEPEVSLISRQTATTRPVSTPIRRDAWGRSQGLGLTTNKEQG